jgi:hypothetical protein
MVVTVKFFEVMISTLPKGTLGSVASLLAATLYGLVILLIASIPLSLK